MKLSLVVPSYGQRDTICAELSRLHALLSDLVPDHELLLVIDGNDDGTREELLRHAWFQGLRAVCFHVNQGKGHALQAGLRLARGELVAFLDAGGDLDPRELVRFLAAQTLYDADIVIGSKRHSLSRVQYPPLRRLYSRVYQLLIRLLFRLRVRDTQVGMKLFRREVLDAVLPSVLVKRFAFDLELLVVAHSLGFRRIVEAPITLHARFPSSVTLYAVFTTLWDTLAIFYRLRIRRWYQRVRPTHDTIASPVPLMLRPAPSPPRVPAPPSEKTMSHPTRRPERSLQPLKIREAT